MPLSDQVLMQWSRSAAQWFAGDRSPPVPEGLTLRDVELAGDVASIMPLLYVLGRHANNRPLMRSAGYAPDHRPVFVEVGTADGSTCLPLCKAAAEVAGHVHSIDPSGCGECHELVDRFGYRNHWTHHKVYSDTFFKTFGEPVDLGFVDGDHRWPVVERDIRNLYRLLREGGTIVVSDTGPVPADLPQFFTSEYDGPDFVPHVSGGVAEVQQSFGIEKASVACVSTLLRAQSVCLPVWPNGCLLIRKMLPDELDPLDPAVRRKYVP